MPGAGPGVGAAAGFPDRPRARVHLDRQNAMALAAALESHRPDRGGTISARPGVGRHAMPHRGTFAVERAAAEQLPDRPATRLAFMRLDLEAEFADASTGASGIPGTASSAASAHATRRPAARAIAACAPSSTGPAAEDRPGPDHPRRIPRAPRTAGCAGNRRSGRRGSAPARGDSRRSGPRSARSPRAERSTQACGHNRSGQLLRAAQAADLPPAQGHVDRIMVRGQAELVGHPPGQRQGTVGRADIPAQAQVLVPAPRPLLVLTPSEPGRGHEDRQRIVG